MIVKVYKCNHHTYVAIVNEDQIPVSHYISNYLNIDMKTASFNSKITYAYELKYIINFFHSLSPPVNLIERIISRELLTRREIDIFLNKATKLSTEKKLTICMKRVSSKKVKNLIHMANYRNNLLKPDSTKKRINRLIHFIDRTIKRVHIDYSDYEKIEKKWEVLKEYLSNGNNNFKKTNSKVRSNQKIISDDKFKELIYLIQPHTQNNPFKHSKFRNFLIISLLIETGIRRGACANIKISDLKMYGTFDEIKITREHDNETDNRLFKARQKTREHSIYITQNLMKDIKYYITKVREKIPNAEKHNFLFVTEMNTKNTIGSPLSLQSYNKIFNKISISLNIHITPHTLRHKWNELFEDTINNTEATNIDKESIRNFLMGWNPDSKMGNIYNEYSLQKKTQEVMKKIQEEITSNINR